MKRQNFPIVALVLFVVAALLSYDSENAQRRNGFYHQAGLARAAIEADLKLIDAASQQVGKDAAAFTAMKRSIGARIDDYNRLADRYNRSRRSFLFGHKDQPPALASYPGKPEQAR